MDHRNTLIQQLTAEVVQLRKGKNDYNLIENQIRQLEAKYRLLADQKVSRDREYQSKKQHTHKLIQEYKLQTQILKEDLECKQSELQRQQSEAIELRRLCEDRNAQLDRLRTQRVGNYQQQAEIHIEQEKQADTIDELTEQKHKLLQMKQNKQLQHYQLDRKTKQLLILAQQLTQDIRHLGQQSASSKGELDRLQNELQQRLLKFKSIQKEISEVSTAIRQIEVDMATVHSNNEKTRSQTTHICRLIQNQQSKTAELQRQISSIERVLRQIEMKHIQLSSQLGEIKNQNNQLGQLNLKLQNDNGNCEKYIGSLCSQNQYLMNQLEKLSEEDQVVRQMLNRRSKVKNSRSKFEFSKTSLSRSNHSAY